MTATAQQPAPPYDWVSHAWVISHLCVNSRTLKARMQATPEHIERPWVNYGSAAKPRYKWAKQLVDGWWMEVNRWRASQDEETVGASAGGTLTAVPGVGSLRPSAPPRSSSAKSKKPSVSAGGGSLVTLARSLASRRS